MIILTGPQRTPDERGDLAEMAGLLGAAVLDGDAARYVLADVEAFYRMSGWECCERAVTDVELADAFGWPVKDLPA
ncbi:hypothetical protein ABT096_29570 [Streptomyces sp. NPDC002561]|uniref:hypothetical protein n=1 Tax=Streptomyces sp. NPDC002561 TaxID=3154418 RepID=UPI00331BD48A